MNRKKWKDRYNPILAACIIVAFCAALYLMQIRVGIEKQILYGVSVPCAAAEGTGAVRRQLKHAPLSVIPLLTF